VSTERSVRGLIGALRTTAVVSAMLWATAATALVVGAANFLPRMPLSWVAPVVALAVFAFALIRRGPIRSPAEVALWVEQQQVSLRYAFITAVQLELSGRQPPAELLSAAEQADLSRLVRESRRRVLRPAGAAAVAALVALLLILQFVPAPGIAAGSHASAASSPVRNRLAMLTAHLSPPAYSGLEESRLTQPDRIAALQGTRIRLTGEGVATGLAISGLRDSLAPRDSAGGWLFAFAMPAEPAVLTLRDREHRRLITLLPRPDSIPEVILRTPEHDTTYRTVPTSPLLLQADATDDVGLARGYWELLVTTGSGEQFETVTRIGGQVALGRHRTGSLRATVRLDTMHLTPGSVINLRAVVFDANDLTGPGRGVSETRTLRIAAVIESTGVAAEPPIPIDSMWMSQRLLNLRTDTLLLDRRRIARTDFASRSVNLSNAQETIRGRVMAVVALLEDDGVGGSATTEDSRLLRQAADAMQEARFDLAVAAPDSARPFMRRALAILDQIRTAKRYHIRGVLRPNPVDLATVRLTGTERADPAAAGQRPPLDLADRRIAERLATVARIAEADPAAAQDSLTFIQVQLLRDRADVAALIGNALTAARQGTPLAAALAPARRRLAPAAVPIGGAGEWSGGSIP
jgi:hypothetical protein